MGASRPGSADPNTPDALAAGAARSGRPQIPIDPERKDGALSIRLGDPKVAATDGLTTPLSAEETQALIKRLEPLPDLARANAAAPRLRPASAAPPPPGKLQPIAFVVPSGKSVADVRPSGGPRGAKAPGPLKPPEIKPEGGAPVASEVRIRFEEPMVPVAAIGIVERPPARIAPAVAGTWRWIDSRVLTFTSTAARFPAASEFVVTVPAGARALSGATLAADASVTFLTQPLEIVGHFPLVALRPDSPMVIELDQDVDVNRLRPFLRVEDKNGKRLAWKPAALADARRLWDENPAIQIDAGGTRTTPGRHVIVAPATAWPSGAELRVVLGKGAPSQEGPIVRAWDDAPRTFFVAPRFTVRGVTCGDIERPRMTGATCPANNYLSVEFSNAIAEKSYRSSMVQIASETPGEMSDQPARGNSVSLFTPRDVGRSHQIRIDGGLVDEYGQPLVGQERPSFTTGPERYDPEVIAPEGLHVLDPRFEIPQWVVRAQAINSVRVQLFAVTPQDFFAFEDFEAGRRATPPGKPVADSSYAIGRRQGAEIRVDLRPALPASGTGHVVAVAIAGRSGLRHDRWFRSRTVAWIQVTKLALSARLDGEKVSAWIHDITPAKLLAPVAGVATSLLVEGRSGAGASAVSDPEGHVGFELLPRAKRGPRDRAVTALLVARSGADSTFVATEAHEKAIRQERALWYVTDDRFTYKPGEKVYVKGWIRWTTNGVNPDLALPATGDRVTYALKDERGNELATGTAKLSAQGGFDLAVALPTNANLGYASFSFTLKDEHHTHPIAIREFRAPAFSVNLNDDVSHAGAAPLVVGESIEMNASARYYAGGGLPGAGIRWEAWLVAAAYQPPGWDLFAFTPVRPRSRRLTYREDRESQAVKVEQDGTLSAESTAGAAFGIPALPANLPSVLRVDATVTDLDRRTIHTSSRAIVVHPSTVYVGLRLRPGSNDVVESVVTDVDGNSLAGVPIQIAIEGVLGSERDRDDAKIIDTQACRLASARQPVPCSFKRRDRKTAYTATASVADARGRPNAAQLDIPGYAAPETPQHLAVVPDKPLYRVGDVAKLDILSTVLPATAVVTFARNGVVAQKRIGLTRPSTVVELPIEPGFVENVWVVVDRYGKRRDLAKGSTAPLPEHTSVKIDLPVDVESARLEMRTWPRKPLIEPGEDATFEVEVKHGGRPVAGAEVALMAVDEAVLALSRQPHADPLAPFYDRVEEGTTHQSTIDILPDQGRDLAGAPGFRRWPLSEGSLIGSGSLGARAAKSPDVIAGSANARLAASRKDFRGNAVFSPLLQTDASGRVALTVKMPDSLTRYRIVALATAKTRNFGKAESAIVTQRRLNARTVAPRFLTQGDTFSLPVLVQNLDSRPRTVDVAVRAANLVGRGPAGKRVAIAGGQRAEVRFDFTTLARGRAVVQTIVTSGDFADASNVDVPVYEPATTESFATYGTVDDAPRFEQLVVPDGIFRDVGGVEVQLASTQLQSLTDAYWYLYAYPHECAEQRSARMLATAAIHDILDLYQTPGRPTRGEIDAQRAKDARLLAKDQRDDGGWGYFGGMKSDPFVTMQVLQALAAQKTGGDTTAKATEFVAKEARSLLAELERAAAAPRAREPDREHLHYLVSLAASALATLAAVGEDVRPRAERLHALAGSLSAYPVDAKARLLSLVAKQDRHQAMRAKLLGDLLSAVHETASSATVATSYVEMERMMLLVSNSKTSALVLEALIRERPDHPVITKLARGVLDGRRHGRWMSTQENLVALQSIRRYFDAYEKVTPNYTGKLWFGQAAYAEQAFVGRSNVRGTAALDWNALVPGSSHDLALVKAGPGRMYYRVGITYAPRKTDLEPLDAGFVVRRGYAPVDDPADVIRLPDGRLKIRLGAKVLVTLETITTTRRHQVALVDPLPAGFEAVDAALATAEHTQEAAGDTRWDFTNLRDDRSEAFEMVMGEGRHQLSYTVRATTPGTFVAAPAKAEEMYSPETFGRSSGQTVLIE